MRTSVRRTGHRTGTGTVALVAGACALTGVAWASPAGAANRAPGAARPAAVRPQGGQVCRQGEVRPAAGLTAQARVCVRFSNGSWVGSGQLVLRATRTVSGAFSWGPRYYPLRPSFFVGGGPFTLHAGQVATYQLRGTGPAEPSDTGADWEVWIGVPNGIRAVGFEAQVISPIASHRPSLDQGSRFSGTTRWTCSARRVSGQSLSGVATLCVRQVRSTLQSKAFLTYTSTDTADLNVGLAVDGVVGTTQNTVPVPASPHAWRTVMLPTSTAQARRQDHRVALFVNLGTTPVLSAPVPVR